MADPCDELQCVNGMCQPKVVGEGVECVCDKGYELQSDGVTCSSKFLFRFFSEHPYRACTVS